MTSLTVRSRSGRRLRSSDGLGAARLGALLFVLLVVAATYVGLKAGAVYVDYREFRDEMSRQGRLGQTLSDDDIRAALDRKAAELELPAGARDVAITRSETSREIHIESEYWETIELPFYRWTVRLHPEVTVLF